MGYAYTVKPYNEAFDALTTTLLEMGGLVTDAIQIAGETLTQRDEALRHKAKMNDKDVNRLQEEVETQINHFLSSQAPQADDLRYITSALKIATALERAGDLAKNITKRMVRLDIALSDSVLRDMQALVKVNISMLDEALHAVSQRDEALAMKVWKRDEEADQLCRTMFSDVFAEIEQDNESAVPAMDIMFAAKNFERIADYATNIAKTVHYVATGEKPKKSLLEDL